MNEKRQRMLEEALSVMDDQYIVEAAADMRWYKKKWVRWATTVAACICVVFGSTVVWETVGQQETQPQNEIPQVETQDRGVVIPATEVNLGKDAEQTSHYVIYEGHVYHVSNVAFSTNEKEERLGEHLGTAAGLCDEWTEGDEYVEFAGSIEGELYAVKGYDPSFMLVVKGGEYDGQVLIRDNGITLKRGADIYEERLGLSNNIVSTQVFDMSSAETSVEPRVTWKGEDSVVKEFVEALKEAEIMETLKVKSQRKNATIGYSVALEKTDGMTFWVRCHEDGYVIFDGIQDVCVKIPEQTMHAVLDINKEVSRQENSKDTSSDKKLQSENSQQGSNEQVANVIPARVVEETEVRKIIEPPKELYESGIAAEKYYFQNAGKPYMICAIYGEEALVFKKYSLSENYEWIVEELKCGATLTKMWTTVGNRYIEVDSKGNMYLIFFDYGAKKKLKVYKVTPDGQKTKLNVDAVLEKMEDEGAWLSDVVMADDDTLIFFRNQQSTFSIISYNNYDTGIRYNISSESLPTEPESMHWSNHVAFDRYDSECYYVMDLESKSMIKRKYGETIPEKLIACEGIRGEVLPTSQHTYSPNVLAGTGYLATDKGIYRGSATDDEWKLWVDKKDMYGKLTKKERKEQIGFETIFDFATALRGYDREYLMVKAPDGETVVTEYWVLY